jgi:beta-fructofuranosidase
VRGRRLIQQPLPELKKLREEKIVLTPNEAGCFPLPVAAEVELDCRKGDVRLDMFTDKDGKGGLSICYSEEKKEITVDRSGMHIRFNESEGESRTRPLENGLQHFRIFVDSSSIEIFVNDGDAVFTSRIFPDADEHFFKIQGDTFNRMWKLRNAVRDSFLI